jgi:hypothetical protein
MAKSRQKPSKTVPGPKCDCECVLCETGIHCSRKPACDHPTWHDIYAKPAKKPEK